MIKAESFANVRLNGGFTLARVHFTHQPMTDPVGREALAQTTIIGTTFRILARAGMSQEELSVTLYHEVLEATTVASANPPLAVLEFNEGDFEREARAAHSRLGEASPETLNRMLQSFGFRGE